MQHPHRPHILYVEDDRDLAALVQARLAQAGVAVDLAQDGEEALAKLRQRSYDLLALDQTLPGIDGLGVIRAIAARGPLPPTVMVTGTGNERIAVETMKLGADDYIIKDPGGGWLALLPAVIERVLAHRRLMRDKAAADAALQQKERELLHAQKLESLGILAGGLAHDFNNILAGIMGYADLAKLRMFPSDPARQDLEVIKKSVQRAADLTRQMLAYAGKGKFVVEAVDLSRMVQDTQKILEVTLSKKAVVKYHLAADLPRIQADASQIHQILLNLVINASDALGDNPGVIAIATDAVQLSAAECAAMPGGEALPAGDYVRLEVADSGCGMEQQTMARIFDPFFTTKFTGRGLGLAAVQGIVRSHQGGIRVRSQPGRGTTFAVYFPVSSPPEAAPRSVPAETPWRGSGKVLVVDDEPLLRDLAGRMVQEAGFLPLTASNGEEAVELYRRHRDEIACVLLDLTMPRMDGAETYGQLRDIFPGVRVILSSGYSEEGATAKFSNLGLAGFIQKPYQLETMIATLKRACGTR